jgi:hypothetical protein
MKRTVLFIILIIGAISIKAQTNKVDRLQTTTATLKNSSRLFATRDDLTSVILIIPADSVVTVLDSDSTYLHVAYQDNEGYIFNRKVVLDKMPAKIQQAAPAQESIQESQQPMEQDQTRFSYLENKYGTNMAARLNAGKIWKGMNSDMVKDSWGIAEKINRVISGNIIKEEWIFRNTWLYFENNTLVEWGPVKNN